jgi:NADPH:quinone reductase-like Zn-dependent oxidoreductase
VASGKVHVPVSHVYRLDEIVQAHAAMEAGTAAGKLVVKI